MINKIVSSVADALAGIKDGATILVGGFGAVGQANHLIEGLIAMRPRDLTIVANNAGHGRVGLASLLEAGCVSRLICSFPRIAGSTIFESLYRAGKIELELVPQGFFPALFELDPVVAISHRSVCSVALAGALPARWSGTL